MYPWLHLGPVAISTYSLMLLCAYAAGGLMTWYEARRQRKATEAILRVALGALGGGLIGAKASMFIFLGPERFIASLPALWYSGQAWTGAFFCGYLGVLLVKRWNHIKYPTGDIFAPALPLAQAIGRVGIWRLRDRMPRPGDLFRVYVIGYAGLRFLVDFTRADDRIFLGLTLVQVIFALTIVGFGYSLWHSLREARLLKTANAIPGNPAKQQLPDTVS